MLVYKLSKQGATHKAHLKGYFSGLDTYKGFYIAQGSKLVTFSMPPFPFNLTQGLVQLIGFWQTLEVMQFSCAFRYSLWVPLGNLFGALMVTYLVEPLST